MELSITVSGAVEGDLDESVLVRLMKELGATPGVIYGKRGKAALLGALRGYNNAARHQPWVVLVDLDANEDCAGFRLQCLPHPAQDMVFRIVVREIESWLMGDSEQLSSFLGIPVRDIPTEPDALPSPKEALVSLARRSRRREIREDMVPRPESGRTVGPAYTSRLIEFVQAEWRPRAAAKRSRSLYKCLMRMEELVQRQRGGRRPSQHRR
jgi:hypothetical protein